MKPEELQFEEFNDAMKALAEVNAATPVPADLEARVMAAFDGRSVAGRPTVPVSWRVPAAGVALAALCALAALLLHRPATVPRPAQAPFIAIPYVAPPAPYERTEIRRMDVPIAALLAAGLEVRAMGAGGSVRADVLIGQDGRPLAIRLVKNSI
jgi:hypothetical protein